MITKALARLITFFAGGYIFCLITQRPPSIIAFLVFIFIVIFLGWVEAVYDEARN
jgi:hypothetical protein